MAQIDCRHFSGYKPCGRSAVCDESCPARDVPRTRLLMIHLGAMGAVVRSTALLAAIRRKFPASHLTWVTSPSLRPLLEGHPRIDRVLTTSPEDQLALRALEFDAAFCLDKSLAASGLLALTHADLVYGFRADPRSGAVLPATEAATELWELGLDDHRKFFVNQKTETRLAAEALELGPYRRDEYDLPLTADEELEARARRRLWGLNPAEPVLGLNTGCGPLMPAKKWTVEFHREILGRLVESGWRNLVLLGGPEDEERNRRIGEGLPVLQSPTRAGLRDGLVSIDACDLVVTGDSLGMHLAIARKKFVVAWFGPSCAQEIDLFDRGVKLRTALECSPCWKRNCSNQRMCYDHVRADEVISALAEGKDRWTRRKRPQAEIPSP